MRRLTHGRLTFARSGHIRSEPCNRPQIILRESADRVPRMSMTYRLCTAIGSRLWYGDDGHNIEKLETTPSCEYKSDVGKTFKYLRTTTPCRITHQSQNEEGYEHEDIAYEGAHRRHHREAYAHTTLYYDQTKIKKPELTDDQSVLSAMPRT